MARRLCISWQACTGLILLFTLTVALSGCSLALPGSSTSASPGKQGAAATPPGTIKEFEVDVLGGLYQIIFDHNGNLWFYGPSSLGYMSPSGKVTTIDVSNRVRSIVGLTPGPDGNMWFIGSPHSTLFNESLGFVAPSGQIKEWVLPPMTGQGGFFPTLKDLVAGPDGNMWYARSNGATSIIGRITPSGNRTEFTVFTGQGLISDLAVGPDGNLWFSISQFIQSIDYQTHIGTLLYTGGLIGRVTPAGNVQQVNYPFASSFPGEFTLGPDGNLWFSIVKIVNGEPTSLEGYGIIDRTRTGNITEAPANAVVNAVKGPDGNMWSIDSAQNAIKRVTPSGAVREFTIPTANANPFDLVVAKDGNLWFAESMGKIGRITPAGQITEFTITSPGAMVAELIVGPDGNLWFYEDFAPPGGNLQNTVSDIGRVSI
ncbi:MAG: hypothetical protein ACLQUY_16940 [Ktedonobacterales bacterium]